MEESYLKLVPETRTRTVTACVPQIERVTYDVQVHQDVPEDRSPVAHIGRRSIVGRRGGEGATDPVRARSVVRLFDFDPNRLVRLVKEMEG